MKAAGTTTYSAALTPPVLRQRVPNLVSSLLAHSCRVLRAELSAHSKKPCNVVPCLLYKLTATIGPSYASTCLVVIDDLLSLAYGGVKEISSASSANRRFLDACIKNGLWLHAT
jgi:hypothetical protein